MSKRSNKNKIHQLVFEMSLSYYRKAIRDQCAEQLEYLASVKESAARIRDIAANGTMEECLDTVDAILKHDLEHMAKTDAQEKSFRQVLKDFRQGRNNYDLLKNDPDQYRRLAAGYVDRNKIGGILPKDGMHDSLRSCAGLLTARQSALLVAEEDDLLAAQNELVSEITERYTKMQRETLIS